MALDVNDLDAFYASPLGEVVRRLIGRVIRARWEDCRGLTLMGYGYCGPYLERYRDEARRSLALMPDRQGVIVWPAEGRVSSALVVGEMLPLPDACIDRALVAHGLEMAEQPAGVLEELCRVLVPQGRALFVLPSRRGLWARVEGTPFGEGRPYSKSQMRELIRDTAFSPVYWGEALYAPPIGSRFFVKSAPAWERVGAALGLPFAGVQVVEAIKQVYRPVLARRLISPVRPQFEGALAPSARRDRPAQHAAPR
ncbi:MAG: class I SAM-dependent methyltransferase [Roseiarcus sp.]